ncbi:SH3 domain-containing protein [Photobacterium swingsii]
MQLHVYQLKSLQFICAFGVKMKHFVIVFFAILMSFSVNAKVCKKGQPCGNSCISWSKTCHKNYTSSTSSSYTPKSTSSYSSNKYSSNKHSSDYSTNQQNSSEYHYVLATKLNVRSSPELTGTIMGSLSKGQKVRVRYTSGKWSLVYFRDSFGWVSSKYLS